MRLPDGTPIVLRALEPEDVDLVREVFDQLGPESRYLRFLAPKPTLTDADLRHLSAVDHCCHEAVVALTVPDGRPVGVARFIRERHDPSTADLAVEVVDSWQERGVGSVLTAELVGRAQAMHVAQFSVVMSPGNTRAARLVRRIPGDRRRVPARGTTEYVVALAPAC